MRLLRLALASALLFAASPAAAQTMVTQDSTLAGLQRVFVKFNVAEGSLDARTTAAMQDAVVLELRKAGIRVLKTIEELDQTKDGVMVIQFVKVPRSLSDDAIFRMDIRQAAQLVRTGKPSFMVTWFYEDNGRSVVVPQFASVAAKKGVDAFISHWMDMNGR